MLLYKNIRPQNAAIDHSEERKESMSFKDADDIELKLVAFGFLIVLFSISPASTDKHTSTYAKLQIINACMVGAVSTGFRPT